jgi:hypothetical protein
MRHATLAKAKLLGWVDARAPGALLSIVAILLGCGSPATDGGDAAGDPAAHVTLVAEGEAAALLSIWGSSTADVWVVGGRPTALAAGPTILHRDGAGWTRVDSGQASLDLWWVFGFAGGDVLFGGSGGTILRHRDGAFEKMTTPRASGIVFGLWGAAPDDVWAVGDARESGAIIWHFDGAVWSEVAPPVDLPPGTTAFKVHGQSSDDVWISCSGGATLHWDGASLAYVQTDADPSLFAVVTTAADAVTAGGGSGGGALYENDGSGWSRAALDSPYAWRGLAAAAGRVYAVGEYGLIGRRDGAGAWSIIQQQLIQLPFHAAWIDPDGGFWGVGGKFDQEPLTEDGFLLYMGTSDIEEVSR